MFFFAKKEFCPRCHQKAKLRTSGYCKTCDNLKNIIAKIQESYYSGNYASTDAEYNYIREEFAFSRNKINLQLDDTSSELTEIEKNFLSTLDSKSAEKFYITGEWIYQHFIDANYLISKFIKNGYLETSKMKSFNSMTIAELKQLLKSNSMKATGTKADLIAVAEQLSREQLNNYYSDKEYLRLTEKGLLITGKKSVISRDSAMEEECMQLILQNRLQDARSKVCEYESKKLVGRGIGINWNNAKKNFLFTMDTKLPFELPVKLKKYENELRAVSIYCNMMGSNNSKRLFLARNKIDFDKELLNRPLQALRMLTSGTDFPKDFVLENEVQNSWKYSENAVELFVNELKKKIKKAGLRNSGLAYSVIKDGILHFTYNGCQIGRIKFGKKTSSMQIITMKLRTIPCEYGDDIVTTDDFVDGLENKSLETYINNIDKWIEAIKVIDIVSKKNDIL